MRYLTLFYEVNIIEELTESSTRRVAEMLSEEPRPAKPNPKNTYLDKLRDLSIQKRPANDSLLGRCERVCGTSPVG